MIEIPAPLFGRRPARVVPDDAMISVQLNLPAQMVRMLTVKANSAGSTMSFVAASHLRSLLGDEKEGPLPETSSHHSGF